MVDVVYIGARPGPADVIRRCPSVRLRHVFALEGSPLINVLTDVGCETTVFTRADKDSLVAALNRMEYDLLLSAGLPIILPVSRMRRDGQRFWNSHPSLLPELRGFHAANGALLFGHERAGVTLHEMEDKVDSGAVLCQRDFPITPDLDLGLVYYLLFSLETDLVSETLDRFANSGPGVAPVNSQGAGSYYRRSDLDMMVDFSRMSRDEILRRIRAFGVLTQGVAMSVSGRRYRAFAAEPVDNSALVERFSATGCGDLALTYDGKLLVQTSGGLVKITRFVEL